jgi:hypothetical protein
LNPAPGSRPYFFFRAEAFLVFRRFLAGAAFFFLAERSITMITSVLKSNRQRKRKNGCIE